MLPKLAFRSCPLLHITFRIYLTFQMHLLFNVVMSSRSMQLLPAYKTEGTLSRLDFACDHMLRNMPILSLHPECLTTIAWKYVEYIMSCRSSLSIMWAHSIPTCAVTFMEKWLNEDYSNYRMRLTAYFHELVHVQRGWSLQGTAACRSSRVLLCTIALLQRALNTLSQLAARPLQDRMPLSTT